MRNNIARLSIETLEQRDNPSGWSFWSDDPNWSFWNDNYVGAFLSGGAQGVVNTVNGVQDAVIGIANIPIAAVNGIAWVEERLGILDSSNPIRVPYIPSPDWSRDLIYVGEPTHELSKFLGGNGVVTLVTLGAGSAGTTGAVVNSSSTGVQTVVVTTSSGAGAVQSAIVVRTIGRGEKVADLIQEVAGLTYSSGGAEHAIITLKTGERLIVQGGQSGISFEAFGDNLRHIILHTHPRTTGPSPADFQMLEQLGQKSSWIYELFGGGLTKFGR
jgi:hypothetical protein